MPNNKKYLSMLGMARRAGKLSMGHDMAMKSVKTRKAKLLLFACDISSRLIDEFDFAADKYFPELVCIKLEESISELHMALGYKAGVITVDDVNFSNRIIELINQEENEYGN
ncbi:MAG: L7Ae/L30e/S12e/Gadd45 family ribosomal protein [Eubacterium sp.]